MGMKGLEEEGGVDSLVSNYHWHQNSFLQLSEVAELICTAWRHAEMWSAKEEAWEFTVYAATFAHQYFPC